MHEGRKKKRISNREGEGVEERLPFAGRLSEEAKKELGVLFFLYQVKRWLPRKTRLLVSLPASLA